jgi:hypothetical protein
VNSDNQWQVADPGKISRDRTRRLFDGMNQVDPLLANYGAELP